MQIATIASVFALLAVSSYPVSAGDWNSLGGFSRLRTVKVHLKNGQEMKGTIQQVEPESLQLALGKSRIHVPTKELAGTVDKAQVGQIVELTTRGGQSLKGTLREANEYWVDLDETKSTVRIPRDDIQRITWRSRGLGALIGLGIGAGGGIALGASHCLICDSGATRGGNAAVGGIFFGLLGTAAGGIIGAGRTLYLEPASAPKPQR
jgi:small nuclear ribonucleoprotein (snRNP)-like protein